ncbi:ATP-binding protein [Haliangium sp.]|uniref:ATP-binding protein n=1 Tax=Haliangium sp. TaxID=2663208 RepID=UPI003D0E7A34
MPHEVNTSPGTFNPLTSEFMSPDEERAFRRWDWPVYARRARSSAAIGSALVLALAYADYLVLGQSPLFAALLTLRLGTAAVGAAVVASTLDDSRIERTHRLLHIWVTCACLTMLAGSLTRRGPFPNVGYAMLIVIIGVYLVVPLRVVGAVANGVGVSLVYGVGVVALGRATPLYYSVLLVGLVFVNGFGILNSRRSHRLRRSEYLRLKAEEAAQQRLQGELEERVRVQRRLLEADRAKLLFLATMGHEIRTPLHAMMTCAELLSGSTLSREQREHVELIRYSGKGVIQLLDEMLDFSRAEAGTLRLSAADFDLRTLVSELSRFVMPRVQARGLSLDLDVDHRVPEALHGDASRLRQVVLNLLENAVKFTERGTIALSVAALSVDAAAATLRFSVTDQGPGVPERQRAAIFEPFVQGSSPYAPSAGSGLGLAICKRLVEAMGGAIGVEDAPGGGSRFQFTVTMAVGAVPHEASAPTLADVPTLSLLVVEDDEVNRRLLTTLLTRAGHEVTVATSGVEAVARVLERVFDAVLMDIRLPGLDGCAATQRIRALPDAARAKVPVIATTANVMAGDDEHYRAAGITRVLAKPIEADVLAEALAEVLGPPASPPVPADRSRPADEPRPTTREADGDWIDDVLLANHRRVIGGEAMDRILELFLGTSDGTMAGLAAAVGRGDAERMAREAHRLCSAADSVGARRFAAAAGRLEGGARAIQDAFAALEQAYGPTVTALRARRPRDRRAPHAAP